MADLLEILHKRRILCSPPVPVSFSVTAHLKEPEKLRQWHEIWFKAGASVLLTHSLEAIAPRLARQSGEHSVNQVNWTAARIAASVQGKAFGFVAGAVAPLPPGDYSNASRLSLYIEQIGALLDGGSDFIVFLGFQEVAEVSLAVEALRNLHHCAGVVLWDAHHTTRLDPTLSQEILDSGADIVGLIGKQAALEEQVLFLRPTGDTLLAMAPTDVSDLSSFAHSVAWKESRLVILPPSAEAKDLESLGSFDETT